MKISFNIKRYECLKLKFAAAKYIYVEIKDRAKQDFKNETETISLILFSNKNETENEI